MAGSSTVRQGNRVRIIGDQGCGLFRDGNGLDGLIFKYSTGSVPRARIWVEENDIWTDVVTPSSTSGGASVAGGSAGSSETFSFRGNRIPVGR